MQFDEWCSTGRMFANAQPACLRHVQRISSRARVGCGDGDPVRLFEALECFAQCATYRRLALSGAKPDEQGRSDSGCVGKAAVPTNFLCEPGERFGAEVELNEPFRLAASLVPAAVAVWGDDVAPESAASGC